MLGDGPGLGLRPKNTGTLPTQRPAQNAQETQNSNTVLVLNLWSPWQQLLEPGTCLCVCVCVCLFDNFVFWGSLVLGGRGFPVGVFVGWAVRRATRF